MRRGRVNAARAENTNQIKYLDDFLQAKFVLNEGLASGYESEVLADFTSASLLGFSLGHPTDEQFQVEKVELKAVSRAMDAAAMVAARSLMA